MPKKLILLIITLILSSPSFSQTDTNKVCIDRDIARKVAQDLVRGDSAIVELFLTKEKLVKKDSIIQFKDSIISLHEDKDKYYVDKINVYDTIIGKQWEIVEGLESDNDKLIKKNTKLKKTTKWLGGGFLGAIAALILVAIIG